MNAAHAAGAPRELDLHGLDPVAQMESVMLALSVLERGRHLNALLDHEPFPLYRMLDQNGYAHRTDARVDGRFDLRVWRTGN
ncbi:MAG: DUF2249 domain-containing protein [Pseudomonadota bacterium]